MSGVGIAFARPLCWLVAGHDWMHWEPIITRAHCFPMDETQKPSIVEVEVGR